MELRQLRYFVAVAETGNISQAARRIFLTQPALSRQIKALEDEIGQCLLERRAQSIRLTPAGEVMLREARELLQQAGQLVERVRRAAGGGQLRVGYAPSLASGFLSAAVASFTQVHPGSRVELRDLSTGDMLAGLEAGKLDIVITVAEARKSPEWQWTPLVRSPFRLAVSLRHTLARRPRVTPGEVGREALLVLTRRDYPEYWESVMGWLQRAGVRPNIAGEYDGAESLLAAVEAGLGVAIVTARTAHLFPNRVRLKPLASAPPALCIAAAWRTDRKADKPLAVFLAELKRAAANFAPAGDE